MRFAALLLALLATLSGSPLRQAEAAFDHARERTAATSDAGLVPPDGGVGDDVEVASLTSLPSVTVAAEAGPSSPIVPPPLLLSPRPAATISGRGDRWAQGPPSRRRIRLQVFRC